MKTQILYTLSLILILLFFTSCNTENDYQYSDTVEMNIHKYNLGYQEFCNLDLTTNFELNAVRSSLYGDYRTALDQAAKNQSPPTQEFIVQGIDEDNQGQEIAMLEEALKNPAINQEQRAAIQQMLRMLTGPTAEELFAEVVPVSAILFIIEQARNYHFTLINEAHYSSQNRAFTHLLLKPLWDLGYRYLALEALAYEDDKLHERGYPVSSTGFYTRDPNFGNLVREAIDLGYTLVRYESQDAQHGLDGTLRDRDQAHNIYEQTWKKDTIGKVLIHAGYGHIFEVKSIEYEPMGYQLKSLAKQDVLTIDQENMVNFPDSTKHHSYYRAASKRFRIEETTIFLDNQGKIIIDPVQSLGVDIQVYHPETRFVYGRPNWMWRENTKQIPLPAEILKYEGNLIQATPRGEVAEAVPVDQFVVSEEKAFLLESGIYSLKIIDCKGSLVATSELDVY